MARRPAARCPAAAVKPTATSRNGVNSVSIVLARGGVGVASGSMAATDVPTLRDFLDELATRLDRLGPDGIRAAIEAHARSLRPSQRRDLLAVFDEAGATGTERGELSRVVDEAVGGLVELADREWYPPRWRSWSDDEDDWYAGEEADAVDDALVAAGEAYLAGDRGAALEAYRRVLDQLVALQDEGPEVHVDAGLVREARNRLVLAAGDGADIEERAAAMVEALDESPYLAPDPGLDELLGADPDAVLDAPMCRALAAELATSELRRAAPWDRRRHELRLELLERADGLDAVRALASDPSSPRRTDTWAWLVERLVELGDDDAAVAAADEGIATDDRSFAVAELADRAGELHRARGDTAAALVASRRAWDVRPTATRLCWVLADAEGSTAEVIDELATSPPSDAFLAAVVALLAGDVDAVGAPVGSTGRWSDPAGSEAQRLAVVARCCAATESPTWPLVRRVLAGVMSERRRAVVELRELAGDDRAVPPVDLGDELVAALASLPTDRGRLAEASESVDRFGARVLGAKHRSDYGTVAELVVLVAVTGESVGEEPASVVVERWDQRYRRFSAFRRELRAATASAGISIDDG